MKIIYSFVVTHLTKLVLSYTTLGKFLLLNFHKQVVFIELSEKNN